ncbi:MAG: ribbon-helix-helix domain-containing protein [Parvularculaceae bacterium]|nr:ribbon-helix-helix domain-containing protein [Parvularculaceae bacterium]
MPKRSISIKRHRTSIALEKEFWDALDAAAEHRRVSLPSLIAEIDQSRLKAAPPPGLASALRVFVLKETQLSGVGDKAD